ncbi:MAG: hypothetical protein WC601_12115 [Desulfotomaculaceae bacterium]
MYPQTHVYFAQAILGSQSDPLSLGSILPDMLIGEHFNHCEAHSKGVEIYNFLVKNRSLLDFGQAVLTHGFTPEGLDYYGDEKYLDYEKGYSFEKARPFIEKTIEACRIPPEMGWWKAHNIIEMGVELLVGSAGHYSEHLKSAFTNHALVSEVSEMLQNLWKDKDLKFIARVERFIGFIELEKPGVESLAQKYKVQMQYKHRVEIDTKKVAHLIYKAAETVNTDLQQFFQNTSALVKDNLISLTKS